MAGEKYPSPKPVNIEEVDVDLNTLSRARLLAMIPHSVLPRNLLMEMARRSRAEEGLGAMMPPLEYQEMVEKYLASQASSPHVAGTSSSNPMEGSVVLDGGRREVLMAGLADHTLVERTLANQARFKEIEKKVEAPSMSKSRDPTLAVDAARNPNPGWQVRQNPDKRSAPQEGHVVSGPTPPKKPVAEGSSLTSGGAPTEDGVGWRPITTLSFERIKRLTSRLYSNKKEVDELVAETTRMMDALRGETAAWKNFSQMIDNLIWTLRAFSALKNHPPEMFVPINVAAPPPVAQVDSIQVSFS